MDAVEGHGTGTTLGDPIEAQALLAVYGRDRPAERPLRLGTLKSNVGHTQAAAGVGGVIKMTLALRHGVLPQDAARRAAPRRRWTGRPVAVALLHEAVPWLPGEGPRRAGVSSFGASGTNAHVILEEAPPVDAAAEALDEVGVLAGGVVPWPVSGRGESGLLAQAQRLQRWAEAESEAEREPRPLDVGFSLAHRPLLEDRAVVVGRGEGLLEGLRALAEGRPGPGLVRGEGSVHDAGRLVFVFPGHGSQWAGMAQELLACSPVFAEHVHACAEALAPHLDWSVLDVLRGVPGAPSLERIDVVQPVLFAMMVSLAELWRACGVHPAVVVGHSQGELAAAHVAGGLSLPDAARVVAVRSKMLAGLTGGGRMASVALGREALAERLARWDGRIVLAAANGPSSSVVSGEPAAMDELLAACAAEDVRAREILGAVSAGHSPQMEALREPLLQACATVAPCAGDVPFHSTVTGGPLDTAALDAGYWYRNAREPVQFEQTVRALLESGRCTFVEVSPHPVLSFAVQEGVDAVGEDGRGDGVVATLRRGESTPERFAVSLAEVWVRGVDVDWPALFRGAAAARVRLPTYPFQRERYWIDSSAGGTGNAAAAGQDSAEHPLLGAAVALADERGLLFTARLSLQTHPWLADHAAAGVALFPGTAFLELALHAGARAGCPQVQELLLQAPLLLSPEGGVQVQLLVGAPDESGRRSLAFFSRPEGSPEEELSEREGWTLHAEGVLAPAEPAAADDAFSAQTGVLAGGAPAAADEAHSGQPGVVGPVSSTQPGEPAGATWPPAGAEAVDIETLYDRAAAAGLEYGPAFQGLRAAWRLGEEVLAEVALSAEQQAEAETFGVHPALLDAALHALGVPLLEEGLHRGRARARRRGCRSRGAVWSCTRWAPARCGCGSRRRGPARCRWRGLCRGRLGLNRRAGGHGALVGDASDRPASARRRARRAPPTLFLQEWVALPGGAPGPSRLRAGVLGEDDGSLAGALRAAGVDVQAHVDLQALGTALDAGAEAPAVVLVECSSDARDSVGGAQGSAGGGQGSSDGLHGSAAGVAAAHAVLARTLELLQAWLADERLASSRLVLLTRGAVAAGLEEDVPNLEVAPVWGLVRSAQSENPGRCTLVDLDGEDASWGALPGALAREEPQLAVREGEVLVPRLVRVARAEPPVREGSSAVGSDSTGSGSDSTGPPAGGPPQLDPQGTVLITGGTGGLGALVARHLVEQGVRSVLLASRRGAQAEGALELQAELEALGADVVLAACDVADRSQLQALLESVPAGRPLRGVVHAAVVLDDGVLDSLTPERLDRALAGKADAAWHLHELTAHLELSTFVLFSSVAGVFGNPGQGSYAAGNAFVDALAAHRRARGLVATSIAWGLWEQVGGVAAAQQLSTADLARLTRSGVAQLSIAAGLELFDLARGLDEALVLAARFDAATLRSLARAGALPPLLRGLVRAPLRGASQGAAELARRLRAAPEGERKRVALDVVRGEVATVLGYASARAIDPQRAFKELGADSLTAVELRNRLSVATGLRLPATLIFDSPTSAALADRLLTELFPETAAERDLEPGEAEVRRFLSSIPLGRLREAGLLDSLLELAGGGESTAPPGGDAVADAADAIDAMDIESLVALTLDGADPASETGARR